MFVSSLKSQVKFEDLLLDLLRCLAQKLACRENHSTAAAVENYLSSAEKKSFIMYPMYPPKNAIQKRSLKNKNLYKLNTCPKILCSITNFSQDAQRPMTSFKKTQESVDGHYHSASPVNWLLSFVYKAKGSSASNTC